MEYTNIAVGSANGWVASVATYSDLPDPVIHNGETYLVIKNQGIPILNFKSKGLWYAETGAWSYLGSVPDILKDDTFRVINSTDITKQVAFDVSAISAGNTRTIKMSDYDQDLTNPIVNTESFNTAISNPTYAEGKVFYDNTKKALSYYNDEADVTINVGQELLIAVRNETGSTIPNGSVVYPAGFSGGMVLIGLAIASNKEKCRLIGVTTHDIPTGENGYVTKFGEVADINTSAFVSGDIAYLSDTVAGAITKVKPTTSNFITRVGSVKIVDAVNGSIVVDSQTSDYTVETLEETGWSKSNAPTIAFTNINRTLTITPTDTNFCWYQFGDKYCKTTDSIAIPDEEGMFVVYYNMGTLAYIKNPTPHQVEILIKNNPLVAYIYWDATNKTGNYVGYELHQTGMSTTTHTYLHFAFGTRYLSGLAPNTISADASGNLATSAQFGIDSGAVTDEDIYLAYAGINSNIGLPIAYLSGTTANPSLRVTSNAGFSVLTAGTGRMAYNAISGGNYVLSEVTNGDFALVHIIAVNENNPAKRLVAFVGQNQYTTLTNARTGAQVEIKTLRTVGILPQEAKAIATFIFETNNTYTNAVKSRVRTISAGVNYVDWRTTYLNGSNAGVSGDSGSTIFNDESFKIIDNADGTKSVQFEVSGISTGQNRIVTIPDESGTLALQAYVNAKIPTGVNNNILLSDGAGKAKDSGKAIGNASGNVPLANGTRCANLWAAVSTGVVIAAVPSGASIKNYVMDNFPAISFYSQGASDMPYAGFYGSVTAYWRDNTNVRIVAKTNNTIAMYEIYCADGVWQTGGSFNGWTQLTDASGNAINANTVAEKTVGNASGNVPLANGTKCVNLYAEKSGFIKEGTYTGTNPLAYCMVVAAVIKYGQTEFYVGYNADGTTFPTADVDNWIFKMVTALDGAAIHVEARKNNTNTDLARWENKYSTSAGWKGWVQLTDASGNAMFPSVATTASAANAYIGANGTTILKSTSSARYKTDIRDLPDSSTLDQLRPVLYKSNPEVVPNDDPTLDHYGFIAEDIDEFDNKLVQYIVNDAGEKVPDGVQYDRITVLLVKRIQELKSDLSDAKSSVDSLSEKVKELEDRLTKAGIQ